MPTAPPRPCTMPACPHPAAYRGRCKEHGAFFEALRYSESKRGIYRNDGGAWVRLRKMVLRRQPLCIECLKAGMIERAVEVDHIIPVRERPDLRLVPENLQALCSRCHSAKTAAESGWRKEVAR